MNAVRTAAVGLAAAALLGLAGCGSSGSGDAGSSTPTTSAASTPSTPSTPSTSATAASTPATSASSASSAATTIVIKDYAYSGASSVAPGTTVTVHNDDNVAHTVTADSGSAFGVTVPADGTATFTAPTKAGKYAYHCDFHANMAGSLTVS